MDMPGTPGLDVSPGCSVEESGASGGLSIIAEGDILVCYSVGVKIDFEIFVDKSSML